MFSGVWRETGINAGAWTVTYAQIAPARSLVSADGYVLVTATEQYLYPAY